MANITIKFPEPQNDKEAAQLFSAFFCPAFYLPESDMIVLTRKLLQIGFVENIFEIISHEILHEVLFKLEGVEATEKLDKIEPILAWSRNRKKWVEYEIKYGGYTAIKRGKRVIAGLKQC